MKVGDLVIALRKEARDEEDWENRFLGIFVKEEYGIQHVETIGGEITGRFNPDFWNVKVVNEDW